MDQEKNERAARTELADAIFGHTSGIKTLLLNAEILSIPKFLSVRESLEEVCNKLISIQDEIGYKPFGL